MTTGQPPDGKAALGATRDWIHRVKTNAVIEHVATKLGLAMVGGRWSPCPACRADRLSKSDRRGPVTLRPGRWYCGACHAHGDAIDLVRVTTGISWAELPAWFANRATSSAAPERPARLIEPQTRSKKADKQLPPPSEVIALWNRCLFVGDVPDVASWLNDQRGVDIGLVEDRDLARVLPARDMLPRWARCWRRHDARLVLPLCDGTGQLVGLRARKARALVGREPKSLAANDVAAVGIFADGLARSLLAREPWVDDAGITDLIVTEGDIDYLLRATWTGEAESAPPVLGIPGADGWPAWLADRIPSGLDVRVDEHQDESGAGRRLTMRIERALLGRCRVFRIRPTLAGKPS